MRSGQEKPIYPNAPEALIAQFESRRRSIKGKVDWGLPERGAALAPGKHVTEQAFNAGYKFSAFGTPAQDTNNKMDVIARELEGEPELHLLHAYCISHGRKRRCPDAAIRLFHRMWFEAADYLRKALTGRWLISAMVTLGDYGETETQRKVGFACNAFFRR